MTPLSYTPLNPERSEIRVLEVLPGPPTAPIRCALQTISLDDNKWGRPRYEAISYVWGDHTIEKPAIWVDGHEHGVTVNLEAALRRFRNEQLGRVLWADAVCINQDDMVEKSVQVPLMGRVYSQATNVLVWLGDSNPNIDLAVEWFGSSATGAILGRSLMGVGSRLGLYRYSESQMLRMGRVRQGFYELLAHPYWGRKWTFQEFHLARSSPVLVCGRHALKGNVALATAWKFVGAEIRRMEQRPLVRDHGDEGDGDDCGGGNHPPAKLSASGETIWRAEIASTTLGLEWKVMGRMGPLPTRLVNFLMATMMRDCSNPLDHVYALYGLLPGLAEKMPLDYDKEAPQLFWETTVYILRSNPLDLGVLLMMYGLYEDRDRSGGSGAPSWTPDFRLAFKDFSTPPNQYRRPFAGCPGRIFGGPRAPGKKEALVILLPGCSTARVRARTLSTCRILSKIADASSSTSQVAQALLDLISTLPQIYGHRRGLYRVFLEASTGLKHLWSAPPETVEAMLRKHAEGKGPDDNPTYGAEAHLLVSLRGKTLFTTSEQQQQQQACCCGISVADVEEGDLVILGRAFNSPAILRRVVGLSSEPASNPKPLFRLVGLAYIYGIMDDEGLDPELVKRIRQQEWSTFDII